ncbi:hypothetical protein HY639_03380 [Candidatus Woesearchaeota archaeon]|nr:hypothetical protein [Candidatus Woesearchaeota archaeon]
MESMPSKRTLAIILVIAVVVSVVATWKVLTSPSGVTYVGAPQQGKVSLQLDSSYTAHADVPPVTKGTAVSMTVEEKR